MLVLCSFLSACSRVDTDKVDRLNSISYSYHYRNIDTAYVYAKRALELSKGYDAGKAEALNNLAFVDIVRMNYKSAYEKLDSVLSITNNQVELLIADVQLMRLCQRESKNKDFYDFREKAIRRQKRIAEEEKLLTEHQRKRMVYANSEFSIVSSTYYYYVGLRAQSAQAMEDINEELIARDDTAQYLNYLYNVGAGGILNKGTQQEVSQQEFDYLMRCFIAAQQHGYIYWQANSLQGLSEHLIISEMRDKLIADNYASIRFINAGNVPDSLLAGNLAERATDLFIRYGDVYQIAGAFRTLASCYWQINNYPSAIICLQDALEKNKAINQAPDLVASIHEQLSVVYAAVNDKQGSDFNRNIYLDLQEQTRQDRYLESRAGILESTSQQLNLMIVAVLVMIALVLGLLLLFHYLKKRNPNGNSLDDLLLPLKEWQVRNEKELEDLEEEYQEVQEASYITYTNVVKNKKRNIEKRAKLFLVNTLNPLIDRMIHEIKQLKTNKGTEALRNERYAYIAELTDDINKYNNVLTQWIQLQQGELSLHIESFSLQQVFDVVAKSRKAFELKGIILNIEPTQSIVKADRVLTLFMINTLAENARKFTAEGGMVSISSKEETDFIEISVKDTGVGIEPEALHHIFDRKVIVDNKETNSHGFGLMNCNGIINKYKKVSKLFAVCSIGVDSKLGEGSRFYFRLPKGIARILVLLCLLSTSLLSYANEPDKSVNAEVSEQNNSLRELDIANMYADSAYFSNIKGDYKRTLDFADTCRYYLNKYYLRLNPNGRHLMKRIADDNITPAEVQWLYDDLPTNFSIILDIRNESAVAALALHDWALYRYNNNVYTLLFKENSADKNLGEYCRMMQRSESNKNVAIVLLILLLLSIFPLYYFMYYRQRFRFQSYVESIRQINAILLSNGTPVEKQQMISAIATNKFPESLKEITRKINEALKKSIESYNTSSTNIELAQDELRRMEFENNKLHVSNNILDNCLSTLKHETMYYPSRISQLISEKDAELETIDELSVYYKELYSMLSMQAMHQVSVIKPVYRRIEVSELLAKNMELSSPEMGKLAVLGDVDLLKYLFELLQKQDANERIKVDVESLSPEYLTLHLYMSQLQLSDEACANLFVPSIEHSPYMICRQIVRENGEFFNRHRCGIIAHNTDRGTTLSITLSQAKKEQ
ncbi:ATP-binding protein [Prevotella intermedia]|uniref:histidine kinase n=1 Tax=Prevotella intermedia TaxID=28131 RepID=A0A2D3LLZ1_PREIN|nr:ATP-binding protein [Prevotella intermedia]